MEELIWESKKVRVSDLMMLDKNPRILKGKMKYELEQSIKKFNYVETIAIDFDHTILAGNQRISIMRQLGKIKDDDLVDVRAPNRKLTDDEKKEYSLRSNRIHADFDYEKLLEQNEKSYLLQIGFSNDELSNKAKPESLFEDENDKPIPEMDLKGFESYDYIMLMFSNTHDWLSVLELLDIEKVEYGFGPSKKIGLGRIIKGVDAIEKIRHKLSNPQ